MGRRLHARSAAACCSDQLTRILWLMRGLVPHWARRRLGRSRPARMVTARLARPWAATSARAAVTLQLGASGGLPDRLPKWPLPLASLQVGGPAERPWPLSLSW